MSENTGSSLVPEPSEEEQYSLNDDRRVKVLSPGAMVAKRFFRNRIAVVGLVILAFMFLFSFLGGVITPYAEDQLFYRVDIQNKEYAGAVKNEDLRFASAPGQKLDSVLQAQVVLAVQKHTDGFTYRKVDYRLISEGADFYRLVLAGDDTVIGIAYKDIVSPSTEDVTLSYDFIYQALLAYTNGKSAFEADGRAYELDEQGGISADGEEIAFVSRYVVQTIVPGTFLTRAFQEELTAELEAGAETFVFTDEDGT
ncbi:MAG: ABC transporter permease, partial [Oscillospiraceae bacterium]|nr:ABC transporter permease [Oscillospiraceae bacterium]